MKKNNNVKLLIKIASCLFIIAFSVVCLSYVLLRYVLYDYNIIEEVQSPNGNYTAIVFEGNTGATSVFVYRLSVLEKGKTINIFSNGNTFITTERFKVVWESDDMLMVRGSGANVYKQKSFIKGITVNYSYRTLDD